VSIIETNQLKLFVVITAIYSENHMKHTHTLFGKKQSFSVSNLAGYSRIQQPQGQKRVNAG
jgi:hypothetical protein